MSRQRSNASCRASTNAPASRPDGNGPKYLPAAAKTSRVRAKCGKGSSGSTWTNHAGFHATSDRHARGCIVRAISRYCRSVSK